MVMRPVQIMSKPPAYPHVCVVCGKQDDRDYFVDLGFDISDLYQPVWEGCVYLCNMCMENVVNSYQAQLTKYHGTDLLKGHTYKYVEGLDPAQGELDFNGTGSDVVDDSTEPGTDGDDNGTSQDSEPAKSSDPEIISAKSVILGSLGLTFDSVK
jgi:hypothetical protein